MLTQSRSSLQISHGSLLHDNYAAWAQIGAIPNVLPIMISKRWKTIHCLCGAPTRTDGKHKDMFPLGTLRKRACLSPDRHSNLHPEKQRQQQSQLCALDPSLWNGWTLGQHFWNPGLLKQCGQLGTVRLVLAKCAERQLPSLNCNLNPERGTLPRPSPSVFIKRRKLISANITGVCFKASRTLQKIWV